MEGEVFNQWQVGPLAFPKDKEYLEDLNTLRFSESGLIAEVNPFFFINESCQLMANAISLFKLGYFDCAFYSIRQALELPLSGLYLFSNPEKMKSWRNLDVGFELKAMVPALKLGKEEYADIRALFDDFFQKLAQAKKRINKYVHKQGFRSLYYHYNSINAFGRPERTAKLTSDFETMLHDAITAVAIYRLVIDPYPILMLDDNISRRMPDIMAENFPMDFIEKYLPDDYVERYKQSKIYKGYYDYFVSRPLQNDAVHALLHWQCFSREDFDDVIEQIELLSIHDREAIALFMLSLKIATVIIDGCISYSCETKLKDSSTVIGRAYYEKIFEGRDYNVEHKGDYISRVYLNDGMTYIFHVEPFTDEDIENIETVCKQFVELYAETNAKIKAFMDNMKTQ